MQVIAESGLLPGNPEDLSTQVLRGGGAIRPAPKVAVDTVMGRYMLATGIAANWFFPAALSASGDSGITKAVADWTACMKETPYASFANPGQAADAGKTAGGQEEFRIAVTDAVCRGKTGFHAALDKVLDKYLTTRMQELARPAVPVGRGQGAVQGGPHLSDGETSAALPHDSRLLLRSGGATES